MTETCYPDADTIKKPVISIQSNSSPLRSVLALAIAIAQWPTMHV